MWAFIEKRAIIELELEEVYEWYYKNGTDMKFSAYVDRLKGMGYKIL